LVAGALKKLPAAFDGGVKKLPPRPWALALEAISVVPSKPNKTAIERCFTLSRDSHLRYSSGPRSGQAPRGKHARSDSIGCGFGTPKADVFARIGGSVAVTVFNPEVDRVAGETAAADDVSRLRERSAGVG